VVQQSEQRCGVGFGGGVWMANAAPAIDDNGDISSPRATVPNPRFARDQLGQSVVRLTWNLGTPAH
jgi:hypothetical protein